MQINQTNRWSSDRYFDGCRVMGQSKQWAPLFVPPACHSWKVLCLKQVILVRSKSIAIWAHTSMSWSPSTDRCVKGTLRTEIQSSTRLSRPIRIRATSLERAISCYQERLAVEGLGLQPSSITSDLQFALLIRYPGTKVVQKLWEWSIRFWFSIRSILWKGAHPWQSPGTRQPRDLEYN